MLVVGPETLACMLVPACACCPRCTQEVDAARGIPCPCCSGPFRAEDKLLKEQEALPDWQVGEPLTSSTQGSSSGGGGGDSGSSDGGRCGYIYCDMAAQLAGEGSPWKCDACGAAVADETAELWGRCVLGWQQLLCHIQSSCIQSCCGLSNNTGWPVAFKAAVQASPPAAATRHLGCIHSMLKRVDTSLHCRSEPPWLCCCWQVLQQVPQQH